MFVLWGMLHGAGLMLHRVWSKFLGYSMPKLVGRVLTFFFVLLAWVPFRAANWEEAKRIYSALFTPGSPGSAKLTVFEILLFAAGFVLILFFKPVCELGKEFRPTWRSAVMTTALLVTSMFFFVKYSPFIYFNF